MTVVAYKNLNYGRIEYNDDGTYNLVYNAPGVGCNLTRESVDGILSMADRIADTARSNINYLQQYIDYINNGYCVVECVESTFMVQDTCEKAIEACKLFQGGYTGHIWTVDEIESLKEPYYKMAEDYDTIRNFVEETYGSIPPPPQPPPPECREGDTKCIGYDLYQCINGKWQVIERMSDRCKEEAAPPTAPPSKSSLFILGALIFLPPILLYLYHHRR